MVAVTADVVLEDVTHHKTLQTLALELRSNAEDYSEDAVGRFSDLQIPHQPQLLDNAKATLELANYAVQVGHHNEKSDRLVVVVGKEDDVRIDYRLECIDKLSRLLAAHWADTRKERPRLVVYRAQTLCRLVKVGVANVAHTVTRRCSHTLRLAECNLAQVVLIDAPDV